MRLFHDGPMHMTQDRLLVKMDEAESKSPGGLWLPDTAQEIPERGVVVEAGPGRRNQANGKLVPMEVGVGDHVLFSRYAGIECELGEVAHRIIRQTDVVAKLDPVEAG